MTEAPKRFYERATVVPSGDGFAVALDGRSARSPGRRPLSGPEPLAEAMAAEWAGQGETLDMSAMPLTRLHGRVLDADEETRALWRGTPVRYARTDLLCYRADDPALASRQAKAWQPYLDLVGERLDGRFAVTEGIVAVDQDEGLVDAVADFAASLSPADQLVLSAVTEITGSAALGLALWMGAEPDEVFAASRLDERFQAERWGVDAEAEAAERALARDFDAAVRYARLAGGQRT